MTEFKEIPINELIDSPFNVRFGKQTTDERLVSNIKQLGVIEPITVRVTNNGTYEVIMGQRRLHHATEAGLALVPCNIVKMSDLEALFASFAENAFKEDITRDEKALAIAAMGGYDELIPDEEAALLKVNPNRLTHEELGEKIGYAEATVTLLLRPLSMKKSLRDFAKEHKIPTAALTHTIIFTKNDKERQRVFDAFVEIDESKDLVETVGNAAKIEQIFAKVRATDGGVEDLINAIHKIRKESTQQITQKDKQKKEKEATAAINKAAKARADAEKAETKAQETGKSVHNQRAKSKKEKAEQLEFEATNKRKAAEELGTVFGVTQVTQKSVPKKTHNIKVTIPYPIFVALSKYEKEATISVDKLLTTLLTEFLEKVGYLENGE